MAQSSVFHVEVRSPSTHQEMLKAAKDAFPDNPSASLHQTFSLKLEGESLPVVEKPSTVYPHLKDIDGTRFRLVRCRVSNNEMELLGKTTEVPVVLYDNVPEETFIDCTHVKKPGVPKEELKEDDTETFSLQYELTAEKKFPPVRHPRMKTEEGAGGTAFLMKVTPEEMLAEKWELMGPLLEVQPTPSDPRFQAVFHIQVAGNPETKNTMLIYPNRPYALVGLELFIDETVMGLTKDSPGEEDRPRVVKGEAITEFCVRFGHLAPPETVSIYPDRTYVPVNPEMPSGSPLMNREGQMVGMVMCPGWARLFTKEDLEFISKAESVADQMKNAEETVASDSPPSPDSEDESSEDGEKVTEDQEEQEKKEEELVEAE